ncbi:uncharacterized protein FTJAE_7919 [Fusarium tjaetaba]|uniref:Uncharacterized protein n=1 Tax=Fusarium tjaetaba TaxID=1567544 RepID=A0A8H5RF25_9HYPO|nr:uncharacterized protein FTJAE_7919 [Fusarium tjaetaba]KAF5631357.1 hypothetical protein FTJAE_7919 [Fusarium tjaetaba]
MNQRRYEQPSSSNSGPEGLSDIASGGPPVPSMIVFEVRKEDTARAEQLPQHFTSLIKDLSREDGQLRARRRLRGLDNPRDVHRQLSKLEKIDLIQWPSQHSALVPWQQLVIIAATIVDKHLGHQEIAVSTITRLHGKKVSQDLINKDERAVREIIQLIDHLYLQWEDLALELLMLLVLLLRPKYKLSDIQDALETTILNQDACDIFWETSHGLPLGYDPIRDAWTEPRPLPSTDLDLSEFIDYKRNYPAKVNTPISGFKAFETSLDLQREVAYVNQNQSGYSPTNDYIFSYEWDEGIHGRAMQQVLHDLAKSEFIQAEETYVQKLSISVASSSIYVPKGHLQIIVPVEASQEPVSFHASSLLNSHHIFLHPYNLISSNRPWSWGSGNLLFSTLVYLPVLKELPCYIVKNAILQIEASEVLNSVHNAESTQKFSSKSLQRLKTLLSSFIKGVASERIRDLEDSDPELVIVYGLCMTTREIDRMKDELWNEVKRQARLVASHLARYLALNAQIAHTINISSNTKFQKAFENLQKDHSLFNAIPAIIIDQQGYFHYIAPQIPQL